MTTLGLPSPSVASRLGSRYYVELVLYGVCCLLAGFLGLAASALLMQKAAESLASGGFGFVQPLVLALLVMAFGLRFSAFLAMGFISHARDARRQPFTPQQWPLVSILVPAYNEEETIEAALASLLQLDYPNYEIVFVDDGSSDRTLSLARAFDNRGEGVDVHVHGKANAGKWSALNLAFRLAKGDFVLCIDADSRLDPDSLEHLVRAMLRGENIGAVAGQIRVRNRGSILTRLQALEYLNCNGTLRAAQTLTGDVLVVPGPLGLFRRSALQAVWERLGGGRDFDESQGQYAGPYEDDTFAEDFDLSIGLRSLGYLITYEPRALSHTEAPVTVLRLLNQRYRWQRGSIQVLRKLRQRAPSNPSPLGARFVAWVFATYVLDLIMVPLWLLFGLPFVAVTIAEGGAVGQRLFEFFITCQGINLLLALCYASTHGDSKRVAMILPLKDLYQTFVLQGILAFVVFDEIRGTPMRWS